MLYSKQQVILACYFNLLCFLACYLVCYTACYFTLLQFMQMGYRDSHSTNLLHTPTPPPRPHLVLCIHRKKGDLMDYLMNFLAQLLCFYGPLTNTPQGKNCSPSTCHELNFPPLFLLSLGDSNPYMADVHCDIIRNCFVK